MNDLTKQRRVSFSDPGLEKVSSTEGRDRNTTKRERAGSLRRGEDRNRVIREQAGSLGRDKKSQSWFQRQFFSMSPEDSQPNGKYATAVAATAFAICSLEEAREDYRRKRREDYESSRDKVKTKKVEIRTGQPTSGRMTRQSSQQEIGESSMKNFSESGIPASRRTDPSARRPILPGPDTRDRKGSWRHGESTAKADAWEKAQIEKIRKRHEKMNMNILAWENEKKQRIKVSMDKKKRELDQRRARMEQHYQIKMSRINQVAGGARAQASETRRNEESRVKERANKIRTGKAPFKCFCFYCPV